MKKSAEKRLGLDTLNVVMAQWSRGIRAFTHMPESGEANNIEHDARRLLMGQLVVVMMNVAEAVAKGSAPHFKMMTELRAQNIARRPRGKGRRS